MTALTDALTVAARWRLPFPLAFGLWEVGTCESCRRGPAAVMAIQHDADGEVFTVCAGCFPPRDGGGESDVKRSPGSGL